MDKCDAAELLYLECRNTLTHELGRDTAKAFLGLGFAEPTVGVWGNVRPATIGGRKINHAGQSAGRSSFVELARADHF